MPHSQRAGAWNGSSVVANSVKTLKVVHIKKKIFKQKYALKYKLQWTEYITCAKHCAILWYSTSNSQNNCERYILVQFYKRENGCSQRLSTRHVTLGRVRSKARYGTHTICFQSLCSSYYIQTTSPFNINKNYIISHRHICNYFSIYFVKYGDHKHVQSFLRSKINIKNENKF